MYVLTDLSPAKLLSGATDPSALQLLVVAFPKATIRFLQSLHAKIYVADETRAIVTSANFTESGLWRNYEYGVSFDEPAVVARIRADVVCYGALGPEVMVQELQVWAMAAAERKEQKIAAERTAMLQRIREFDRKVAAFEMDILRARTRGVAPNQIFERAILHLLHFGPKTTRQVHWGIHAIHPDLCEDSVHRVIDGYHYGKKWKHALNSAQQDLKRRREIGYS